MKRDLPRSPRAPTAAIPVRMGAKPTPAAGIAGARRAVPPAASRANPPGGERRERRVKIVKLNYKNKEISIICHSALPVTIGKLTENKK